MRATLYFFSRAPAQGGEEALYRNGHQTEPGNAQRVDSNGCVANLPPPPTASAYQQSWSPSLDPPLGGGAGEGAGDTQPSALPGVGAVYIPPIGAYSGARDEFGLATAEGSPAGDSGGDGNGAAPVDWANVHTCEKNMIPGAGMPPPSLPREEGVAADRLGDSGRNTQDALMNEEDDPGGRRGEDERRVCAPGDDASGPPSSAVWPAPQVRF